MPGCPPSCPKVKRQLKQLAAGMINFVLWLLGVKKIKRDF